MKNQESTLVLGTLVVIAIVVISYLLFTVNKNSNQPVDTQTVTVVSEENGTQYIDLTAKGGYYPNFIEAKASVDTVLRVKTTATFDCSSAITIPSLNYRATLPPTGITEIKIPPQNAGSVLKGTCSMGMYKFNIKFI